MMTLSFIEEYHDDLKAFVPIPELQLEEGESVEDLLVRMRPTISRAIAAAVTMLVEFKVDTMPCFAIESTDFIFNIGREESADAIDNCIQYFEEIEDYEVCAKLTNIKSRL
jgi:hypothetical protein